MCALLYVIFAIVGFFTYVCNVGATGKTTIFHDYHIDTNATAVLGLADGPACVKVDIVARIANPCGCYPPRPHLVRMDVINIDLSDHNDLAHIDHHKHIATNPKDSLRLVGRWCREFDNERIALVVRGADDVIQWVTLDGYAEVVMGNSRSEPSFVDVRSYYQIVTWGFWLMPVMGLAIVFGLGPAFDWLMSDPQTPVKKTR